MARSPKSDRAHQHNALSGSQAMMMVHLRNVFQSDTTTDRAKSYAQTMLQYGALLSEELRIRKD